MAKNKLLHASFMDDYRPRQGNVEPAESPSDDRIEQETMRGFARQLADEQRKREAAEERATKLEDDKEDLNERHDRMQEERDEAKREAENERQERRAMAAMFDGLKAELSKVRDALLEQIRRSEFAEAERDRAQDASEATKEDISKLRLELSALAKQEKQKPPARKYSVQITSRDEHGAAKTFSINSN